MTAFGSLSSRNKSQSAGFTLLELLIAMTMLAVIMAFVSQNVMRSSREKVKLQGEIDRDSRLTNALRVIERDITLAFHHRHLTAEVERAVKQQSGSQGSGTPQGPGVTGQTPTSQSQTNPQNTGFDFELKDHPQYTHWIGDEKSLHFTSLSNVRTSTNQAVSDQQEVGYYLERCSGTNEESEGGECLWRRTSPYIDDDITKGGNAILLLEDVTNFKLKYYGENKLDWVTVWRTDQGGDDVTKDSFPWAVEISITIKVKQKESSVATVIPLAFPNNKKKKDDPLGGVGQPGAGTPGVGP